MHGSLDTAGERIDIECGPTWVADLLVEGSAGELLRGRPFEPTMRVVVEADRRPFATDGWRPLTRGAYARDGAVVVENACTAGFDMLVRLEAGMPEMTFRWRPPRRDQAAAVALRSRFHLLARAVLVQFPALWWAGTRGRAPLHASACTAADWVPLFVAAGGVGRSTLVLDAVSAGECATGDNLVASDGRSAWGLVEPLRVEGGGGRRMPHGRREATMDRRVASLSPDCVLVVERSPDEGTRLGPCPGAEAARAMVTSTYMAGELRRFWGFAAILAAGTGVGPEHPPVSAVANRLASELPCRRLLLGAARRAPLTDLLTAMEPRLEAAS
jgi:hypothetical protein